MNRIGKKKGLTVQTPDDPYSNWDVGEDTVFSREYGRYVLLKLFFILACIVITFFLVGVSITVGDYPIGVWESYEVLWKHIIGVVPEPGMEWTKDHVVWNLRLPRIILAVVAGAGLAVAGAAMQSVLKNPLADPYTTGISSGAAFGATLVICYGSGLFMGDYALVANAFVFSLVPTAAIILISRARKVSPVSTIMAGIAIMYIFNALTTVIKLRADPNALAALYLWQVGSFNGLGWKDLPIMLTVTVVGSVFVMAVSNKLNILAAGDEGAKALGLNPSQLRVVCLAAVSLMAASVVSFTGIIGFVGLVAPHVVRIFIGADNRYLVPASMAFGAALLLMSDLVGRTIIAPSVLQVGVVTSFLGGPLFLWLILRQKKEVW
ncbi:MAG: iron ABC transporter permease [archaeon]|nr:iron ABC transporter permease [archaeon]